ncbi:hypothetical protein ACFE04_019570 [Oxalis oulophora]
MIQRPESLCKDNWYGIDSMLELREEIDNSTIYISYSLTFLAASFGCKLLNPLNPDPTGLTQTKVTLTTEESKLSPSCSLPNPLKFGFPNSPTWRAFLGICLKAHLFTRACFPSFGCLMDLKRKASLVTSRPYREKPLIQGHSCRSEGAKRLSNSGEELKSDKFRREGSAPSYGRLPMLG